MELASFTNLPTYRNFDPIGLTFTAKTKANNDRVFFWVPPHKEKSDRLFKWQPHTSSWKECPIASLSEKKRSQLKQSWESQPDIGLWISHAKRLAQRQAKYENSRVLVSEN